MPLICCSEPCVPKAHSFQAADSLRLVFKSERTTHMPLTNLCWSVVATPLPQPEICMCKVPFEPKGLRKYIYIMVLWRVPKGPPKCTSIDGVGNVPFRPKGPKNTFLLGPLSTRSHRTSNSCPLDLLGMFVHLFMSEKCDVKECGHWGSYYFRLPTSGESHWLFQRNVWLILSSMVLQQRAQVSAKERRYPVN
jgi:hypothetical protein